MSMKKWSLFLSLYFCLCLLSACGGALSAEQPAPVGMEPPAADPGASALSLAEDEEPTILTCRIVDGAETGELLLAELGEGLYGGTGVYRLSLGDIPVLLDGEAADASALEDGKIGRAHV